MKKIKKAAALRLNRETLRSLTARELHSPLGAAGTGITQCNVTESDTCCRTQ
jgi:hypothetical protein